MAVTIDIRVQLVGQKVPGVLPHILYIYAFHIKLQIHQCISNEHEKC